MDHLTSDVRLKRFVWAVIPTIEVLQMYAILRGVEEKESNRYSHPIPFFLGARPSASRG